MISIHIIEIHTHPGNLTEFIPQRSSGGALDGLGGGSGANSILSARGTGNFLTRLTAILATIFFITSLSLSLLYKSGEPKATSILESAPAEQSVPDVPSAPVAAE